ncbi:PmoA family protein [Paractinoplanes ferrugineus]|uniref:Oxidoreductase n=1 Tax=Paractinoplanes ferrugineus TaxID=113564 RepID=A0A919MPI6_9ACTN|nr:PmoA family protein [Actinoplanes ferrugineus]GIE15347.1 oxidoreductase [Actinoplanes ferrugineus]
MTTLDVAGVPVATYVEEPDLDIRLAPRPYLHPVRTLSGITVTDALCHDHPWHLGASLTMSDVDGHNLWGGRTYVRDQGYVWLDDHGRIQHRTSEPIPGGFRETLSWLAQDGTPLLRERREMTATAAPRGWELSFAYALSTPASAEVTLGSPATHGRPGDAGYGGFFWRAPSTPAVAFAESTGHPHGSADPWLALVADNRYTLVFRGLADADRWFVRTTEYVGVCAALAFTDPLAIKPAEPLTRTIRVLIADGALTRPEITEALRADRPRS